MNDQAVATMMGSAALAAALAFLAVHYVRERMRRKRLKLFDHRAYVWRWNDPRR